MAITYKGETTFDDRMEPRAGKSDWGIDTLTRRIMGPSTGLATFLASLSQGATYSYNGAVYYLQTWEPDDDPVYATVGLNYKGLKAGIPTAVALDDTNVQTTSIDADVTSLHIANGSGVEATRAVRDIEFDCPQTTWRYISLGRPAFATYGSIANGRSAIVRRSIIRLDNGIEYRGNAPVGVVSALTVALSNKVTGPHVVPIFGTPYFECEDLVQNGYWN
jgi:hypothetical protein